MVRRSPGSRAPECFAPAVINVEQQRYDVSAHQYRHAPLLQAKRDSLTHYAVTTGGYLEG
jgi:hypothetical protein